MHFPGRHSSSSWRASDAIDRSAAGEKNAGQIDCKAGTGAGTCRLLTYHEVGSRSRQARVEALWAGLLPAGKQDSTRQQQHSHQYRIALFHAQKIGICTAEGKNVWFFAVGKYGSGRIPPACAPGID